MGNTPSFRIGAWTVEPSLNQIASGKTTVRLESKAMEVLAHLAQRPGEVVSREELLAAAWPGLVVGDDSLTQVVIKLRKALGDAAESPAYIQTIPKRGYRLVAPVTAADAAQAARRSPWRRIAVAAGASIAAATLAAWWLASPSPALPDAGLARDAQPTVAVRPFEALGNDAQATLLAEGITADLATDLSKVAALSVIAVGIGGEAAPAARYVVGGSVQRAGGQLRVHVRLTESAGGRQLWSERFDRPLSDFFAIQDELGPKILQVLPAKVSEAELRRVAQRYTHNLEAYAHFQRGQQALLVRQRAENEAAREMFRRAIALDAGFARAYAGLALTYAAEYRNQWGADGAVALARAFELARTAYGINPDSAETHWVLAFVHLERRQHAEALRYLEAATQLYPSFADGYALMGGIHTYLGQPVRTVPLLRTALRLAPQGSYLYFLLLGRAYLFLGDVEQARVNLEQALARNPVNLETHVYMAALHVLAGDHDAAAWEAEEIRVLQPRFTIRGWLATDPMTDARQRERLVAALEPLGF